MAVGCSDTCACAHARVLMCMLGYQSNLVMGFFKDKTFHLAVARTRDSSLPLFPLYPSPLSQCLKAAGRILYLGRGLWHFSTESCWQGPGEKSSAAGLVFSLSFRVHLALAAVSWANRGQGCGDGTGYVWKLW